MPLHLRAPLPRATGTAGRRALLSCLLALCLGGAAAGRREAPPCTPPPAPRTHPSDGPDVDLRLRIDAKRVRLTAQLNLAFVDAVTDLPRENEDRIHEAESPLYESALVPWLLENTRVVADGVEVQGVPVSFELIEPGPEEIPLVRYFPLEGLKALRRVKIEIDHLLKSPPKTVAMAWFAYPVDTALGDADDPETPRIQVTGELSAEGKTDYVGFTAREPEQVWTASGTPRGEVLLRVPAPPTREKLRLPLLAVGLVLGGLVVGGFGLSRAPGRRRLAWVALPLFAAAAFTTDRLLLEIDSPFDATPPLPSRAEAEAIFRPLHANIYRAFDYTAPADVHDQLARSVAGPLLETLFEEVFAKLTLEEAGGAVARVQAVRMKTLDVEEIGVLESERPSFTVFTRYELEGSVFHWGHVHERTTLYTGRYVVTAHPEGWRITAHQPLGSERLSMIERPAETKDG